MLIERITRATLALLITVPAFSGCATEVAPQVPSVEGQLYAAELSMRIFCGPIVKSAPDTRLQPRRTEHSWTPISRQSENTVRPRRTYQEASRRLGLALYNNETVQVVNTDYRRLMARAERDNDPLVPDNGERLPKPNTTLRSSLRSKTHQSHDTWTLRRPPTAGSRMLGPPDWLPVEPWLRPRPRHLGKRNAIK